MKNPIEWAKAIIKAHGWVEGWRIANTTGRERFGKEQDVINLNAYYYRMARGWMRKRMPPKFQKEIGIS